MRKVLRGILIAVLALVCAAALGLGWLTLREFRPADREPAEIAAAEAPALAPGQALRLVSWNIGYAGLGAEADFFMDGGRSVRAADKAAVERSLAAISAWLSGCGADLCLLQEVDARATRTYGIDERPALGDALPGAPWAFAKNFSVPFVPYPLPPIGHVESGLMTLSSYAVSAAERVSLPCPFSWPLRIANLKRCLLVTRLPVGGDGKELVIVNLHLEAYDGGEGKIAQAARLARFLEEEYARGNYVIAGGDFNQLFPGAEERWPVFTPELWQPGVFDVDVLPAGFRPACDLETPTCRLLNKPYDPADAQYYVIDGFILSPNVRLDAVETVALHFADSDHNPVLLDVTLE